VESPLDAGPQHFDSYRPGTIGRIQFGAVYLRDRCGSNRRPEAKK
jgi:hypothetical protein